MLPCSNRMADVTEMSFIMKRFAEILSKWSTGLALLRKDHDLSARRMQRAKR